MNASKNPPNPILVVDDEEAILLAIDTTLRIAGYDNVVTCNDSRIVMDLLSRGPAELMLLDLTMPNLDGQAVLSLVSRDFPDIPVIIVTGTVDVDMAVTCMKGGAFDYVIKPVEEDRLVAAVSRALSFRELKRENFALNSTSFPRIWSSPRPFRRSLPTTKKCSPYSSTSNPSRAPPSRYSSGGKPGSAKS